MSTICGEQEFEFLVAEVLIQRLSHRHSAVMLQPIRLPPTEVTQKSVHVDFADNREELVQRARFFWKLQLEAGEVDVEIRRNGKARAIGKMKMVHRIHLDPAVRNAEIQKQFPRDRRGVSEQRVKVGGGVEGVPFAPERAAISADHIVLLSKQHAQPFARQQVRANQTADARADNHGVVRIVRRFVPQSSERSFHLI